MIPPMVREPRYPGLDAWRAVACLMVILHHAGYGLMWADLAGPSGRGWAKEVVGRVIRQMDLGVPIFFVISGYCIAASLDGHRRRGAPSWAFLRRRFRRIYPPYWAAIAIVVATTWGLDRLGLGRLHAGGHSIVLFSPGELSWPQWLGNVTLAETWRPRAWAGPPARLITGVAWTLCYEEQFYLVGFATLLVAPRRLFGMLAAATVAIVSTAVVANDIGRLDRFEGTFFHLWHEFAVGLAVYWSLVLADPASRVRWVDAGLVALLAFAAWTENRTTATASATGLALIAFRGLAGSASCPAWLGAMGRRSYSIYLIHLPLCVVGHEGLYRLGIVGFWARLGVTVPLLMLGSVAAGWVFFDAVESRFLGPRRSAARPVAGEAAG